MTDLGNDKRSRQPLRSVTRDSQRLGSLDLFSKLAGGRAAGELLSERQIDEFLADVRAGLLTVAAQPGTLHGWRVQELFRGVVVALDAVTLLKDEDSGDLLNEGQRLVIPDYRVVTKEGQQLLVEVKNIYQKDPKSDFVLRQEDLDGMVRYAALVGADVHIAIYWARWNLWTLVRPEDFARKGNKARIGIPEAMKFNRMYLLGDRTLGTEYPLQFRLRADPDNRPQIAEDGEVVLTIHDVELLVADRVIESDVEKQIAWNLMLYGGWEDAREVADVSDEGLLGSVTFELRPLDPEESGQPWAMHRPMSSMFSTYFNYQTLTDDGDVTAHGAKYRLGQMSRLVVEPYTGTELRLWRFTMRPSDSDDAE